MSITDNFQINAGVPGDRDCALGKNEFKNLKTLQ